MKKLNLQAWNVKELNREELKDKNGGLLLAILGALGGVVVGAIGAVALIVKRMGSLPI